MSTLEEKLERAESILGRAKAKLKQLRLMWGSECGSGVPDSVWTRRDFGTGDLLEWEKVGPTKGEDTVYQRKS